MTSFGESKSNFYSTETLKHWQSIYPDNIRWNFENAILSRLAPDELLKGQRVELDFPLEDTRSGDPIAFYCWLSRDRPIITLPILSLKFLDDLSIASAWLESNRYSQETLMDYISMLKYTNPISYQNGTFPLPLKSLHVPDNVLDNHLTNDLSQKILKSSLIWILAHELGHILLGHLNHAKTTTKQAQENEIEADEFATEMFRRIGIPPVGIALFFVIMTHWLPNRGDFDSDNAWEKYLTSGTTHPVSTTRLKLLADMLRASPDDFSAAESNQEAIREIVLNIAHQINGIAERLQQGVQLLIRARALTVTPESLAPRHLGELFASGMDQVVSPGTQPFSGIYTGVHTRKLAGGDTESLGCSLILYRSDNMVTGRFSFGIGEGVLNGRILNDELYFDWEWSDSYGRGAFQSITPTEFIGSWGYKGSRDNGGTWVGSRD